MMEMIIPAKTEIKEKVVNGEKTKESTKEKPLSHLDRILETLNIEGYNFIVFLRLIPANLHFKLFKPLVFSDISPIILYTFLLFFYRFIETISETWQKTSELQKKSEVQRFLSSLIIGLDSDVYSCSNVHPVNSSPGQGPFVQRPGSLRMNMWPR